MALIPLGFWAASGAGAGGGATDFQLISTQVLGSAVTSVTFSSIPSTFRHLQIRYTARSTISGTSDALDVRLNGDTANNYSYHELTGSGASVGSSGLGNITTMYGPSITGNTATASAFGAGVIDILDYAQATKNKTVRMLGGQHNASDRYIMIRSGAWRNTSAITSATLYADGGSLQIGSRFSLYGWN